jgi:chromosome partitioning protein
MVNTLQMMGRSRKKALEYTVLPLMYDRRTQSSVTSLRTIRNTYPQEVWPGHIPVDTKFRDASRAGIPPHLFDPNARGVEAYQSLFKFLMQKFSADDARLAAGGV